MPLTRRLILQKARHHPTQKRALTDCKHTVSGTISLSRGTFHHSSRYYSAIGHNQVFRLTGWSGRFTADSTSPLLLGDTHQHQQHAFSRTGLSPSTAGHSKPLPLTHITSARHGSTAQQGPTTPHTQPLPGITRIWFSQNPRSLAATSRIIIIFFLRVLRCFTSPRSLHTNYFIHRRATTHHCSQVSPFGHPRINALLATPRGLSRPYTSFIGLLCQGIHRVPLKQTTHTTHKHAADRYTHNHKNKERYSRPLYSSQTPRKTHTNTTAHNHSIHTCLPNRNSHPYTHHTQHA